MWKKGTQVVLMLMKGSYPKLFWNRYNLLRRSGGVGIILSMLLISHNLKQKGQTDRNSSSFHWSTIPQSTVNAQLTADGGKQATNASAQHNWQRAVQAPEPRGHDVSLRLTLQHSWINTFLEILQLNSKLIPCVSINHKKLQIATRYVTAKPLRSCKISTWANEQIN